MLRKSGIHIILHWKYQYPFITSTHMQQRFSRDMIPFNLTYLHKFKCADTYLGECGAVHPPSHYYPNCPITGYCHSKKPIIPPKEWLRNILNRHPHNRKLLKICLFSERSIKPYVETIRCNSQCKTSQSLPPVALWVLTWQSRPEGDLVFDHCL